MTVSMIVIYDNFLNLNCWIIIKKNLKKPIYTFIPPNTHTSIMVEPDCLSDLCVP